MQYVSTRGSAPVLGFGDVLLSGLARDGGLYVPESWPTLTPDQLRGFVDRPYAEVATEVMAPYVAGSIDRDDFAALVSAAYATFDHPDVVPLRRLDDHLWLAELFHGPTLAFKDVALQLVGRLFDHELARRGERVTIVAATSGDTGSAAIEACRDRDAIEVFVLHPRGRVSEVQRRQMTTVDAPNVHNVAIEGTFDDCQDLVKALFADEDFRDRARLSAVNSINWARIMAQIVYYATASARVGGGVAPVRFAVPTGNFGNIFAGYAALRTGVPIARLLMASNQNDILTRLVSTGSMEIHEVRPSLSPAMDIQVSSNLERLLFELFGRDGAAIADLMQEFRSEGRVAIDLDRMAMLRETFSAGRVDDEATVAVIRRVADEFGVTIDPHTAVGVGVALDVPASTLATVCLATAAPAKFPDAVEQATGERPALPQRLAGIFDLPERMVVLPADLGAVREHIAAGLR